MRIFLDSNVLFSGTATSGTTAVFLALLEDEGHTLVVDEHVVAETRRNVANKAPHLLPFLEDRLKCISIAGPGERSALPEGLSIAPKDVPILLCAINSKCEVFLTGDKKHFGRIYGRDIEGVTVLSPAMFVERYF